MNSLTHQDVKFKCSNQDWAQRTASRRYNSWQEMEKLDSEIAKIHKTAYESFMAKYAPQTKEQPKQVYETDEQVRLRKQAYQAARNAEFAQRTREDEAAYRRYCDTSPEAARRYVLAAAANGRIAALAGSTLHRKQVQAGMHKGSK